MIQAKNIQKIYGSGELELKVLKGVDLHVKQGEFLAIMGRSGAGKSTLLYQLSLLDRPTTGDIKIDGRDVSVMDEVERTHFRLVELGYVFQDYAIIPELTAVENVMLPMLMKGTPWKKAQEESARALEQMGLGDRLGNLPSQLSGGEQQRVSIARAIAHKPKILFADEPTANLDGVTAGKIIDIFRELHKAGQTIVMVTHEIEYGHFADRIITLDDGKIVSDVKPKKGKR